MKLHLKRVAIANVGAAIEGGIAYFDSPRAAWAAAPVRGVQGAVGNVTTEDVVFLCQEMGVKTGIDLGAMGAAGQSGRAGGGASTAGGS